ncbi:nuclear transport factor 2 family protein [Pseudonocardia sp. TRM90224]|uniref:nuclear transport factor 2 family protein n=1 Tax=Pseudonocardia sp. TRM90224 TaxID=2812678 RepID=UPI001E55E95E|nr:nuclear transport factor 2 family protein [Pseudonocardia sp. TRM90224]
MARSDLDIVRDLYAAFARRDLDTIRAAIHPAFVMEQSAALPWGGTRRGPDGFFAFLGSLLTHLDPAVETEQLYDSGQHIVQIGHTRGTVHATGAPFHVREIHIWQLEDGKLRSYHVHVDVEAMQAALDAPAA